MSETFGYYLYPQGPKGDKGDTGPAGPQGPQGLPGQVESVNGLTGNVTIDKQSVGLGNVDNTSDLNKPVSTATQTALGNKLDKTGDGSSLTALPSFAVQGNTSYGGTISSDLNTISKNGFYTCYGSATGAPNSSYNWFVIHQNSNAGTVYATQRAIAYSSTLTVYERVKISSTWGDWVLAGAGAGADPYPFSVVGGNTTNERPDVLGFSGNTLSFKVGGSYPALKYSMASGLGGSLSSISNKDCSSLTDGRYFILSDKTGNIHTATRIFTRSVPPISGTVFEYDKWGNVAIASNVASGFNTEDFLTSKDVFTPGSRAWEIGFSFKMTSNDFTQFIASSGGNVTENQYGIVIFVYNQKLSLLVSTDGTTWGVGAVGITTLYASTHYWGKCIYTGSAYEVYLSTDGINYSLETTVSSSTPMYARAKSLVIGRGTNAAVGAFSGSIYLEDFYIKYSGIKNNPIALTQGDIYLNINSFPFSAYKYVSSSWVAFDCFVIGEVVKLGGTITAVKTYPYKITWDNLEEDRIDLSRLFYMFLSNTAFNMPINCCINYLANLQVNNVILSSGYLAPVSKSDSIKSTSQIFTYFYPYCNKLNKFVGDIF